MEKAIETLRLDLPNFLLSFKFFIDNMLPSNNDGDFSNFQAPSHGKKKLQQR